MPDPVGNAPSNDSTPPDHSVSLHRLTQPDWCNAPQPSNWVNACMRAPGHDGDHAVRKPYRWAEAWTWPTDGGYPVRWTAALAFPDLWIPAPAEAPDAVG